MNIRIYQVNLGRDYKHIAFQGLEELEQFQGSKELDSSIYDCAFAGQVDCKGLEEIFQRFNIDHPEGYKGRSLSVSDMVEITESDDLGPGFYFCDSVGFKKVDFDAEKAKPYKNENTMRDYFVTITETLKMKLNVEAESMEEAIEKVKDGWRSGEYILDADHFEDVDFEAEDIMPKVEMSYPELSTLFSSVNDKHLSPIVGYIVFTPESFDKEYNEASRTYCVSSNNKAYQSCMGGYSIYASCLDGTDPCIRLEGYMRGENAWKIDKCYMLKPDYDKLLKDLEPYTKPTRERDER